LLDAQILLDVYLAMTGGQTALILGEAPEIRVTQTVDISLPIRPPRELRIVRASQEELAAHARVLATIDKASGGRTVWRSLQ
jgi:DNA polymerase-3 subunit epsilon